MKGVFAMKFSELDTTVQESIVDLLNNHIAATADILKQDRCLTPMLMIPESNQLVSLQSRDGSVDVDRAYAAVVGKLKNEAFTEYFIIDVDSYDSIGSQCLCPVFEFFQGLCPGRKKFILIRT